MNFVDSLKKWFFNNSSSAATTTSKVPLVDNTGNPIGCDTLAHLAQVQDLASVLGVSIVRIAAAHGTPMRLFRLRFANEAQAIVNVYAEWGGVVNDVLTIGTNASAVFAHIKHLGTADSVKYYYATDSSYIYVYAQEASNDYYLTVGQMKLTSASEASFSRAIAQIPSGATQITELQ